MGRSGTLRPGFRAGANENTTITFTDPVRIEGQALDKGTYGLHMIPTPDEWTEIFSKASTAWGSYSYDAKEDALRVKVKPQAAEFREELTYELEDVKPNAAVVSLHWEKLAVPFRVEIDTHQIVSDSLCQQLRGIAQYSWQGWDDAANYLLDKKFDLQEALKYADRSIALEERFDNLLTKSRIQDTLGQSDAAKQTLAKALGKASPFELHLYARRLQGREAPGGGVSHLSLQL